MHIEVPKKLSIRKNDTVQVMAGREKGKTGKVLAVSVKTGRVTIEKTNMAKRHVKPSQKNPQGGVIEKELPLHYSNVLLMCPKCNKGVRHGIKIAGEKKTRVCKRCESSLDVA
jgi:large subunit ribosomal protein L24